MDLNNNNWELAWSRCVKLSSESTAHGFHRIYRTSFWTLRLAWILLFVASTGFCGYLIIGALINYFNYEVTTKIRLEYQSSLEFPMITLCNTKTFMTRSAYDFTIQQWLNLIGGTENLTSNDLQFLYGNLTQTTDLTTYYNSPYQEYMYMIQSQAADPLFDKKLRKSFGFSLNEFVMGRDFARVIIPYEQLTSFYDPNYGNCYRFNSGTMQNGSSIPLQVQKLSGETYGFRAILFVDAYPNQSYNFMNLFGSNTFGVRISIDSPQSFPLTLNNMIPIETGKCVYIAVKKIVSKSLPKPYSSCEDLTNYRSGLYDKFIALNKTYSQNVCYQLCMQMKVINQCNCTVLEYPNIDANYPTCQTWDQIQCYWYTDINVTDCDQYCPLECESVYFDLKMSSERFPDMMSVNYYKSWWPVQLAFKRGNIAIENVTYDDFSKSLSCIHVFYEDMRVETIQEAKSMTEIDLFASMGGSLGLCLGMSILSFFEFVEVLVECLIIIFATRSKQKVEDKKNIRTAWE